MSTHATDATTTEPRQVTLPAHDGLTLVGDEFGSAEGRPVLLMHGGGQNRFAWKNTGSLLAERGYRVVSLDARGHGDSDWSEAAAYEMDHYADDVEAVLATFDQPPALVGASMGGVSALLAQSRYADRPLFSAVVLVDVTPEMEPEGVARIVGFMSAHPDGFASLEDAAAAIAGYNPDRPASGNLDGLRKVLRQRADGRWIWHWDPRFIVGKDGTLRDEASSQDRMRAMAEQLFSGARLVSRPMLLVRGVLSDLVSDRTVASFRAAAPDAEFVEVDRAGHMVAGDRNDIFAAAVVDFLARHVPTAA